jgi:hypothetical protein
MAREGAADAEDPVGPELLAHRLEPGRQLREMDAVDPGGCHQLDTVFDQQGDAARLDPVLDALEQAARGLVIETGDREAQAGDVDRAGQRLVERRLESGERPIFRSGGIERRRRARKIEPAEGRRGAARGQGLTLRPDRCG